MALSADILCLAGHPGPFVLLDHPFYVNLFPVIYLFFQGFHFNFLLFLLADDVWLMISGLVCIHFKIIINFRPNELDQVRLL